MRDRSLPWLRLLIYCPSHLRHGIVKGLRLAYKISGYARPAGLTRLRAGLN